MSEWGFDPSEDCEFRDNWWRIKALESENAKLRDEVADWERSFELYHRAITALTTAWKEETGEKLVLPDTSRLCEWAAQQIANNAKLRAVVEAVKGYNYEQRWRAVCDAIDALDSPDTLSTKDEGCESCKHAHIDMEKTNWRFCPYCGKRITKRSEK